MMKSTISALLMVILFTSCWIDCVDKKTGSPKASATLVEARKNQVFKFEMQTNKALYALDSGRTFKIKNVWVENCWKYECIDNNAVLVKDSTLQIVVDAIYSGDVYMADYWLMKMDTFQNEALGNHLGARLDFTYRGQDTFYLALTKRKDLAESEEIIDTLQFIKKHR